MTPDVEEFYRRCGHMAVVIEACRADLHCAALAHIADENGQDWADKVYDRLGAMTPNDLALCVVLLLHPQAEEEANREWSAIHTMTPEDVT